MNTPPRWFRTASTSLLVGALLLGQASAASLPFTLEQIRSYALPDGLVAADDVPRIAWISNDQGRRNVWIADGEPLAARQLTRNQLDDGQELTGLAIAGDGKRVVYVRGGDHGANWDGESPVNPHSAVQGARVQLWAADVETGHARPIDVGDHPVISPDNQRVAYLKAGDVWIAALDGAVEPKRLFAARGALGSLAWSPDGTRLAFVSKREAHALIGVFSESSSLIQWLAPSTSRDDSPRWSPDGKYVAYVRHPGRISTPPSLSEFEPKSWQLWTADATSGAARRWYSSALVDDTANEIIDLIGWGTGGRLLFRSYHDGWPHLYSVAEQQAPLKLTTDNYEVESVALSRNREFMVYSANAGSEAEDIDRRHLLKVPVDSARPVALTSGSGIESMPVLLSDDRVAFISSTPQRPPQPATLHKDRAIRVLTELPRAELFSPRTLVAPEQVTFKSPDGITIHGQLFKNGESAHRAAVIYVHGGPKRQMLLGWHSMATYANDYAVNHYLASRGFIVLSINFRLGTGYGRDFQFPRNAGPRGLAEYQDVLAAARYLQSRADVDSKRIGIYGGSYGGYLTAVALARNSDVFAAGVDVKGVHDWVIQGYRYGWPKPFSTDRFHLPADIERATTVAWESSPVFDLSKWTSPALFIHADDDRNVDFSQTVDLVQRLRRLDVPTEELVIVDDTHSFLRHSNVLKMNAAIAEFLERQLYPRK